MSAWHEAQELETAFWGDCANTFDEELKQRLYAELMGLALTRLGGGRGYDLKGASVLDIGGGPVSLLLKCDRAADSRRIVIDPCPFPPWVMHRYTAAGITLYACPGEVQQFTGFDEAWIYNVLQHTTSPAAVVAGARRAAKRVRLFEWIDVEPYPGHPHKLTRSALEEWLERPGSVMELTGQQECFGRAFYGDFRY